MAGEVAGEVHGVSKPRSWEKKEEGGGEVERGVERERSRERGRERERSRRSEGDMCVCGGSLLGDPSALGTHMCDIGCCAYRDSTSERSRAHKSVRCGCQWPR